MSATGAADAWSLRSERPTGGDRPLGRAGPLTLRPILPQDDELLGQLVSGLTPQAREGAAMAILGLAAADGLAITLPQVTGRGATRHLDGRWWLARSAANDRAGGPR